MDDAAETMFFFVGGSFLYRGGGGKGPVHGIFPTLQQGVTLSFGHLRFEALMWAGEGFELLERVPDARGQPSQVSRTQS